MKPRLQVRHDAATPTPGAWNMAMDEALLWETAATSVATLRFYAWSEPAATFGYSQRYAELESVTRLRPLIRRPTGGGLVPHDRDWTYSLAVPPGSVWYELSAVESYRRIHTWVVEALARLGIVAELAPCCRKEVPGQCFVGHEQYDVLWYGRKIAGAAQRRNQLGLLIQGSLQPRPEWSRTAWEAAMVEATPDGFFAEIGRAEASPSLEALAAHLRDEKYLRDEYLRKR